MIIRGSSILFGNESYSAQELGLSLRRLCTMDPVAVASTA